MNERSLAAGLYLVATPIGNARDITLRALDVLAAADVIAAEDTRTARRLMDIHGVALSGRPLVAYHDHSGARERARLAGMVAQGKAVAYLPEAGTPLVSDPGFALARAVREVGGSVTAVPGPSALLAALCVAGQPTDRFAFGGFLPARAGERRRALGEFAAWPGTLVFYESPRRVPAALADMAEVLGPDRPATLCRELTKRFEEVATATLRELSERIQDPPKGEVVIVIGPRLPAIADPATIDAALGEALETMRVKDAATVVAQSLGIPRRQAYARALELDRHEPPRRNETGSHPDTDE